MSSSDIHPSAIISPDARLAKNVCVGPYSIIENNVTIDEGTILLSHAYIGKNTIIGKRNIIHMGCVLGHEPQHKEAHGEKGSLLIGDDNVFREYVTIHRATVEGGFTRVGNSNYLMAFSHIGHDSVVQNHVTVTNASLVGGHSLLEDYCVLAGGSAVHQNCRVGAYSMIGGISIITKDLPPYMLVGVNDNAVGSINLVALRRAGFSEEVKRDIKNAYKLLYLSGLNLTHALEEIAKKCHTKEALAIVEFIKGSRRGILEHRRHPAA